MDTLKFRLGCPGIDLCAPGRGADRRVFGIEAAQVRRELHGDVLHDRVTHLVQVFAAGTFAFRELERPKGFAKLHVDLGSFALAHLLEITHQAVEADGQDLCLCAPGQKGRSWSGRAQHRRPAAALGEDAQDAFLLQHGFGGLKRLARASAAVSGNDTEQLGDPAHGTGRVGGLRAADEFHRPGRGIEHGQRVEEVEVVGNHQQRSGGGDVLLAFDLHVSGDGEQHRDAVLEDLADKLSAGISDFISHE